MTQELDLSAYLQGKGIQVSRSPGNELIAACFFDCSPGHGGAKGKGKLYLNADSWLWECKVCGERGNRVTLLRHFGDDDGIEYAKGADPMRLRRILTEAADLAHEMLLANDKHLAYLLNRGIGEELIVNARLGYVPQNVGLSDMLPGREEYNNYDLISAGLIYTDGKEFFNDSITIPYFSHGTVVQIREKRLDGKYRSTQGAQVYLYGADVLFGATDVLVTEGELDRLACLTQIDRSGDRYLQSLAVVGLPGAGTWPDGLIESLKVADKVFIGLDSDDTGRKAAEKLAAEVGSKARLVNLPKREPDGVDWTDWYLPASIKNPHGGHDWRDLRNLLVESDLAGKQMFTVIDAGLKWDRRESEAPGLKLGWPSIDAFIRPGLKPGQLMIPLAKSGTGKSAWLSNIVHHNRGRRTLYISLELMAAEVFEHLRRIHFFWNDGATREQMLGDYPLLQITELNRLKPGDVPALISEYTTAVGEPPELLLVDYLQYFARGFRGTPYERASDAAMELKAVSKEYGLGTICPSQVSRRAEHGKPLTADDARDSGVVDETGDFVPALFRPDRATDAPEQMATGSFMVQLLKSRHGNQGRTSRLLFSNMSLAIVDPQFDKKNAARVDQENAAARQGIHYIDWRRQREEAHAQGALIP